MASLQEIEEALTSHDIIGASVLLAVIMLSIAFAIGFLWVAVRAIVWRTPAASYMTTAAKIAVAAPMRAAAATPTQPTSWAAARGQRPSTRKASKT